MVRSVPSSFLAASLLSISACSGAPDGPDTPAPAASPDIGRDKPSEGASTRDTLTLEGRIESGVECPVLHTPDGDLYALALGDAGFGPGDYVRVTGSLAQMSYCQQGRGTIRPDRIEAADPPARDRDPARAGGLAVTSDYVQGRWVAKGLNADCDRPDFTVTRNRKGGSIIETRINGVPATGYVDVGDTPALQWDEGIPTLPIETRGPEGLAVMPAPGGKTVTLAGSRIAGDGVVFVKCAR